MKKKITSLILLCLVVLLACTLIACNKDGSELVSSAPEEIGPGIYSDDDNTPQEVDGGYALLSFQFVDEMSSLFHSITIDENEGFDITSVNYIISYTKGGTTTVSSPKPLSLDYLDSNSQALLSQKGHHTIYVSIPYGTSVLKGSFSLHLRYAYEEVEYVELKFNLEGGISRFASYSEDVATIKIEKNLSFTYEEFYRNFTIIKANSAIDYFEVDGNSVKKLQRNPSEGASSSITITDDTTFKCIWTTNTINVKFSIDKPADDATLADGAVTPTVEDQSVQQSVGVIVRPIIDMNAYNGYYFAGWYTEDGKVWNFTTPVGQDDITLYAHWTIRYYSTTIYPMGGQFKSSLQSDNITGKVEATCTINYSAVTGLPSTVEIGNLTYGKQYSNYYVNVKIDNETKTLLLSTLFSAFEKPITADVLEGKISSDSALYSSQTCESNTEVKSTSSITASSSLYVKWNLNVEKTDEDYIDVISAFYTDVLFKNSYSIKADGSIKVYDIQDETFNEIIVPDYIVIDGVKRYISEIGDKGVMNVRSLGKLDLSDASHLTRIGDEAFINCKNLYDIEWPTTNNITEVGYSAFSNTQWETNKIEEAEDSKNPGSPYIVINNVLYKYIDLSTSTNRITTLDMNDNAVDLQGVTVIAEKAFKDSVYLKEITLLDSIVEIKNNVFINSDELSKITAGASLQIIRASAFDGTLIYDVTQSQNIEIMQSSEGEEIRVVVVGNVLDDVLDKNITSFKFDDSRYAYENAEDSYTGIKYTYNKITQKYEENVAGDLKKVSKSYITAISEEAFETCDSLATIEFDSIAESKIKYVGQDAFATPVKFLSTIDDGYFIINETLVEYYNSNYYFYDAVIPDDVSKIASEAFGGYSRYLKTIQIGEDVEEIDEYAFLGATNLESLLFSDVIYYNGKLYNLPSFNALAFSNEDGALINDIDFYFNSEVLKYFAELAAGDETTTIANELLWLELYVKNTDHFKEEKIEQIYVNTAVVPTLYVVNGNVTWGDYDDGLILVSSAGVIKYEKFEKDTLEDSFNYSEEGTFTVNINKKTNYTGATYVPFEYRVVHAIMGNPTTYNSKDSSTIINGDNLSLTNGYKVEGFTGISTTTNGYPVFYTSKTTLDTDDMSKIKLKYKTWMGNESELALVGYSDFAPNSNSVTTIIFTFKLCDGYTYKIQMSYKGVESKVNSIQQTEPISIPLNADVTSMLEQSTISFYGQDALVTNESLNMDDFNVVSVNGSTTDTTLYSNALGLVTLELKYKGSKKVVSSLENLKLVYAVVLEGDATQFTFDRKGNGWAITSHNNKTVETLVIPSSYTNAAGLQLDVIEICDDVFNGYTNMTTLYLPSTIKTIGAGAFKNCSVLRNIYSSESIINEKTEIDDSDFNVLTKEIYVSGTVEIKAMDLTSGTIVIPDHVTYTTTSTENAGTENAIDVTTTVDAIPVLTEKLFDSFTGELYLDYSENNFEYVKSNLIDSKTNTANGIIVVFMFDEMSDVDELNKDSKLQFLLYNDPNIAFVNGETNPTTQDGQVTDMPVNYLFYYVVSSTQERKTSTQQRHFTLNTSSLVIESRTIDQTRELKSLSSITSGLETIIVGDTYETFKLVEGTYTGTKYSYDYEKEEYVSDELGEYKKVTKDVYELIDDESFGDKKYSYNAETKEYSEDKNGTYKKVTKDVYELLTLKERGVEERIISSTTDIVATIKCSKGTEFVVYLPDTIFDTCTIQNSSGVAQTIIIYKHGESLLYSTKDTIPTAIEYIGNDAFEKCIALKSINLSEATKLSYIGTNAFAQSGLTSIDLSKTLVEEINNQTFQDCTDLVTVKLSKSTTYIGQYAFDGCTSLVLDSDFFANLKTIQAYAFNKCTGLITVDMTNATNLTKIGTQAFSNAGTTITISKNANKTNWAADWYGFCVLKESE